MHDQILHTPDIHTQIIDQILHALAIDTTIYTKEQFHRMKNPILAQYAVSTSPTTVEMLDRYRKLCIAGTMTEDIRVMKILRKRAVRSLSGVAVISLLTKFWGCP
jgi:histone acetyltransferase (RNA polymerase elongator complex component)